MSIDLKILQNAIFDWAALVMKGTIPEEKIFWREQSAHTPPRPSVGLKILFGPDRFGSFDSTCVVDGKCIVGGQRMFTISVNTFGKTSISHPFAYQAGIDLHASLTRPSILQELRSNGIAVQLIEQVQDISFVEETEYEERSAFEFKINVASNVEDQPGFIETVDTINGSFPNKK